MNNDLLTDSLNQRITININGRRPHRSDGQLGLYPASGPKDRTEPALTPRLRELITDLQSDQLLRSLRWRLERLKVRRSQRRSRDAWPLRCIKNDLFSPHVFFSGFRDFPQNLQR